MTRDEAYKVLGLTPGASPEEIKAAYRDRAKSCHPDVNNEASAEDRFLQVKAAYDTLLGHCLVARGMPEGGDGEAPTADPDDGAGEGVRPDPIAFVRAFMGEYGLEILFDGSIQFKNAPRMASRRSDVAAWLTRPELNSIWLIDNIMLEVRLSGIALTQADITRAVRQISREDQKNRLKLVTEPLLTAKLDALERAQAEQAWEALVTAAFEIDVPLGVAILKHFIWQVKRKLLGRPVRHHLMPVVFSPLQGGGKTTFVLKFLGPLRELAAGPALLSDFADRRSAEIYRFPAVLIDDVERIDPGLVPLLKSVVTTQKFMRRRLGSSMTVGIRQLCHADRHGEPANRRPHCRRDRPPPLRHPAVPQRADCDGRRPDGVGRRQRHRLRPALALGRRLRAQPD